MNRKQWLALIGVSFGPACSGAARVEEREEGDERKDEKSRIPEALEFVWYNRTGAQEGHKRAVTEEDWPWNC